MDFSNFFLFQPISLMFYPLGMIIWDPDRNFFTLPYLDHPVTWYGFLFAIGFLIGYLLTRKMFASWLKKTEGVSSDDEAMRLADRLSALSIIGTVIGARLGHVFFYGWPYYKNHISSILKIWEGGLASHGAAAGILIGLVFFLFWSRKKHPQMTFLTVLDLIVLPGACASGCIRIGNFINQEITGMPTSLPWGVSFMHPMDGLPGVSVHPVQLYESVFYFFVFGLLFYLFRKGYMLGLGLYSGLFFLFVFVFRFFIEFIKAPQSELLDQNAVLDMGQILSLPFICLGAFLLGRYFYNKKKIIPAVKV